MQSKEGQPLLSSMLLSGPMISSPSGMLSASQEELKAMLQGETRNLLEKKMKLFSEIGRVSESDISPNLQEVNICLDQIKLFRNEYLNETVDFIRDYKQVLKDISVLDEWIKEIDDISKLVKDLVKDVTAYALQLSSNSPARSKNAKHLSDKYTMASLLETSAVSSEKNLLKNTLPVPIVWKLSSNNLCLILPFLPRMCAILPGRWSVGRSRLWSVATVGLATFCQYQGCLTRQPYFRPVREC